MNPRPFRTFLAKLILLAALVWTLSCAPETRHDTLAFFFDGVPPLHAPEQKTAKPKPGTEANGPPETAGAAPVIWPEHKPTLDEKTCNKCHNRDASFVLVKPMSELCVTCHAEKTREFPCMHGPVAVGECGACHEPHRSKYPHLLRAPSPQLCFQCHDRTPPGGKAAGCARPSDEAECTRCHNPHGSKDRFFLTGGEKAPPPDASKAPTAPIPEAR